MPDADAIGAVLDGGVHRQPLRRRVLAGDHDVDVMAAAQTVVPDRQQAVGVRRKIDAHDGGLLVDHVVDEAGVLVGEAVMHLLPDVGCEKVVERRDLPPPRQLGGDLQPLGMLVEHGIDDVNECLIAIEQTVPAREQVPFEPPSHWCSLSISMTRPSGARNSSLSRRGVPLPWVASNTAFNRLESVSSGPKIRKLRCSRLSLMTSRRNDPSSWVSEAEPILVRAQGRRSCENPA